MVMKRELPEFRIEDTVFEVDVERLALVQKTDRNKIFFLEDMRDVGDGYVFDYRSEGKEFTVKIPELVHLDPVGMAKKYGAALEQIQGMSDFEVMVDQKAYNRRLMGHLPQLKICSHDFYVDIRMDKLRPKDDFLSSGIVFSEIQNYFDNSTGMYIIPYHPQKREFQEPRISTDQELVIISFPHESRLDPVGFNRERGFDIKEGVKVVGVCAHFTAETLKSKELKIRGVSLGCFMQDGGWQEVEDQQKSRAEKRNRQRPRR
jgi:hypothetical protein